MPMSDGLIIVLVSPCLGISKISQAYLVESKGWDKYNILEKSMVWNSASLF